MPTVLERLRPYELQFLGLIDLFSRVWGYDVELRKVTLGKDFRIRNQEVWEVILADRDMFVLDFASWMTSFARKNGFLDALTNEDLTAFVLEEEPAPDSSKPFLRDEWVGRDKAFARLFRARAKKRWVELADVRHLKARLAALTERLEKQRDARAHIYDGRDFGTIQNLGFDEIANVFQQAREVLRDVRLLVDRSSHHFPDVKEPSEHGTARDLVDLVLLGLITDAVREWLATPEPEGEEPRRHVWQHRAAYYDRVHGLHDAGAPGLFNDVFLAT
jgi:hypothetical protein